MASSIFASAPPSDPIVETVSSRCMHIVNGNDQWISATVLDTTHATTALHCLPTTNIGDEIVIIDNNGQTHITRVHLLSTISDYVVFKKVSGKFLKPPRVVCLAVMNKYVVAVSKYDITHSYLNNDLLSGLCCWRKNDFVSLWTCFVDTCQCYGILIRKS